MLNFQLIVPSVSSGSIAGHQRGVQPISKLINNQLHSHHFHISIVYLRGSISHKINPIPTIYTHCASLSCILSILFWYQDFCYCWACSNSSPSSSRSSEPLGVGLALLVCQLLRRMQMPVNWVQCAPDKTWRSHRTKLNDIIKYWRIELFGCHFFISLSVVSPTI